MTYDDHWRLDLARRRMVRRKRRTVVKSRHYDTRDIAMSRHELEQIGDGAYQRSRGEDYEGGWDDTEQ